MKTTIFKIAAILAFGFALPRLEARIVTLTVNAYTNNGPVKITDEIAIGTNEVATVLTFFPANSAVTSWILKDGLNFGFNSSSALPMVVAGPAVLRLVTNGPYGSGMLTVKIEPESFSPDKTLIVPDGQGAAVHLETSTNLLDWQDEWSNAYTNRVGNKFFRIRAERTQ